MRYKHLFSINAIGILIIIVVHIWGALIRTQHPFYITYGFWDSPITISGAYRLLEGIKPHTDYSSPLGPVSFMIPSIGMLLVGKSMKGYTLGVIFYSLVCSSMTFIVLRRNLVNLFTALFISLLASSYLISPRIFNYEPEHMGLVGIYNVEGFLLFTVIIAEFWSSIFNKSSMTIPSYVQYTFMNTTNTSRVFYGMFGFFTVGLCFLKITFGTAALGLIALLLVINHKQRFWNKSVVLGLVVAGVFWSIFFEFKIPSMLVDYQIPLASRSEFLGAPTLSYSSMLEVFTALPETNNSILALKTSIKFYFFILIWSCTFSFQRSWRLFFYKLCSMSLIIFATLTCEAFFAVTVTQPTELFLTGLLSLFIFGCASKLAFEKSKFFGTMVCLFLFWKQGKTAQLLAEKNIESLNIFVSQVNPPPSKPSLPPNSFRPHKNFSDIYSFGPIPNALEELANQINICGNNQPVVLTIGQPNLVTPMLNLPAAPHAPLYDHYGVTFSNVAYEKFPERFKSEILLRKVDLIAYPTTFVGNSTKDGFFNHHKEYIDKNFKESGSLANWRIYCRLPSNEVIKAPS